MADGGRPSPSPAHWEARGSCQVLLQVGGIQPAAQPGLAGGMSHVTEAIRQLMGRGGERQVKNARLGYVNGNGGIMSEQASLILERRS